LGFRYVYSGWKAKTVDEMKFFDWNKKKLIKLGEKER
jgi:hypothetical protein